MSKYESKENKVFAYTHTHTQTETEKETTLTPDSKTGASPARTHGLGIWNNPRVPIGIRVDKELKKQFSSAAQALFGSTCLPIECFMASVIGAFQTYQKLGVSPSATVNIGEIKIERNLRERRKLTRTVTIEEEEEESTVKLNRCEYCGKESVGRFRYRPTGKIYGLCRHHAGEFLPSHTGMKWGWEFAHDEVTFEETMVRTNPKENPVS